MGKSEADLLESMYEYSLYGAEQGKEYVVRGAEVFCSFANQSCCLNLPQSHGVVTADGRPLITYSDSKEVNVGGFGKCNVTEKACKPHLTDWSYSNNNEKIYNKVSKKTERAVTKFASAECRNPEVRAILNGKYSAGVVIQTSGQVVAEYSGKGVEGAIEITEDEQRRWRRGEDGKDFFGQLKFSHAGIYNFGIYNKEIKGTVFLYKKKAFRGLEYVGAYELLKHEGIEREGFADEIMVISLNEGDGAGMEKCYWTLWADFMLDANTEYYIEVDCPNVNSFEYRFIGNRDQLTHFEKMKDYHDSIIGSAWFLDSNYNYENYKANYTSYSYYNAGVPVIILNLNYFAKMIMFTFLKKILEENSKWYTVFKDTGGDISTVMGIASLITTAIPQVSIPLSVIGLIVSNLPKSCIEELCTEIADNLIGGSKIIVSDCQAIEGSLKYFVRSSKFDVPESGPYLVFAADYLKGEFPLVMKGFSVNDNVEDYIKAIDDALDKAGILN